MTTACKKTRLFGPGAYILLMSERGYKSPKNRPSYAVMKMLVLTRLGEMVSDPFGSVSHLGNATHALSSHAYTFTQGVKVVNGVHIRLQLVAVRRNSKSVLVPDGNCKCKHGITA